MPEKIIIDFEDEENKKAEDKIIVDFDKETSGKQEPKPEINYKETVIKSKINSYYRGNPHLSNFFESDLKFPEGIELGFRKMFSIKLDDEFFNSIIANNKYIILSSKNGSVYLVDRFSGQIEKIFFEFESFEKTGVIYENVVYINSLKKIFLIDEKENMPIYNAGKDYFIWSNLNLYNDQLFFIEYSQSQEEAFIKILNIKNHDSILEYGFAVKKFVGDNICIANESAYIISDNNLLVYDIKKMIGSIMPLDIKVDENSFIFYLNYRIYITSHCNELYYLDIPSLNYKFKYSGIKNNYINSIGGFEDNIFLGTLDGWKFYKSSGLLIYGFEDEHENKIECISKNVLIVSQKNKIIFCNLNRFQEAEGYVISSDEGQKSIEIISSSISKNEIFILTKNGILEAFTNDKLNIHV